MAAKLNTRTMGTVRLKNRLRDLQKGDVINDIAFNKYAKGGTAECLNLWNVIKANVDVTGIYKAVMVGDERTGAAELTLKHKDGYCIVLHGVNAGYYGTGTRGCEHVLKDCGFSEHKRKRVFDTRSWTMIKSRSDYSEQVYNALLSETSNNNQ